MTTELDRCIADMAAYAKRHAAAQTEAERDEATKQIQQRMRGYSEDVRQAARDLIEGRDDG